MLIECEFRVDYTNNRDIYLSICGWSIQKRILNHQVLIFEDKKELTVAFARNYAQIL